MRSPLNPPDASSPTGRTAAQGAAGRAKRNGEYRAARDEYAAIQELRLRNPIAAHIRERRYELGMTQQQVAEQVGTSHSYISRVEKGRSLPTLSVLKRIFAVLDEEIEITVTERVAEGEQAEQSTLRVPELAAA